jgi:hypothetical protein
MKVTVNIYRKEDNQKIDSFTTSAINIRKAFYNYVSARFFALNITATECYYKLSN